MVIAKRRRHDADEERDAGAVKNLRRDIAARGVRSEPEARIRERPLQRATGKARADPSGTRCGAVSAIATTSSEKQQTDDGGGASGKAA